MDGDRGDTIGRIVTHEPVAKKTTERECPTEGQCEFAAPYVRRVEQSLVQGQHDKAVAAIADHMTECFGGKHHAVRSAPLGDCGIEMQTINLLAELDVTTIGDLATVGVDILRSTPRLGHRRTVLALQTVINRLAPVE